VRQLGKTLLASQDNAPPNQEAREGKKAAATPIAPIVNQCGTGTKKRGNIARGGNGGRCFVQALTKVRTGGRRERDRTNRAGTYQGTNLQVTEKNRLLKNPQNLNEPGQNFQVKRSRTLASVSGKNKSTRK